MKITDKRLAELADILREAGHSLLNRRQRTALALIGIVIGTASVVGTIIIGYNAQVEAARVFRGLGIDTMVVQSNTSDHPLTWPKTIAIRQRIGAIDRVAPAITGETIVANGFKRQSATVIAVDEEFPALAGISLKLGRGLLPVDGQLQSAVVGSDLAEALSEPGRPVVPGAHIIIGDYGFTVVGIADASHANPLLTPKLDESILVPPSSAPRVNKTSNIDLILLHYLGDYEAEAVANAVVVDFMKEQHKSVNVHTARQSIEAQKQQQAIITRLLAAIGGISLIVGGIGVTNVMLMGLMERRGEFGLRIAIGATPSDIMLVVVVEGGILGLSGGLIGTVLGTAIAAAFAYHSGWMFIAPAAQLPLGAVLASLVGILFGLYPALQAARVNPVVALRAE